MGLRGLIMGLRGLIWGIQELIWGLRGLILSSRDQISGPSRLDEGLRPLKGGGTDGRMDGRMEIHPCVLQDIGPLGFLPCFTHNLKTLTEQGNGMLTICHSRMTS